MADALAVDAKDAVAESAARDEQDFVELFTGLELSAAETTAITLRWPTHLIVLAGAEGSGKTTVLTSVYEHLSQGSFPGLQFAGSRSLLGFEKICHANRLASGGSRPATERTVPDEEASYYHLALREPTAGGQRQHVLLSALSGELYRWARNSREECEKLTFLHRADAIIVLVDGAKLAAPEKRTTAHADAAGILDSFLDAKMLAPGCRVEFVFSKLDRIRAAGESALAFLKQTQGKLEAKFRSRVPQLTFREIAARPTPSAASEELSDGLAAAFAIWIASKPASSDDEWQVPPPPVDAREFAKFGWRHFEEARRVKP